ncbi:hypothetical protein XJ44_03555 [Thermosipho affectus]|uniref:GGDEF domain-containing protein n=1 Tax=Thermosipho affectus TaxID=660294 RepID=A0ABX3II18_9BACT|nr:hypothetical protein XJ44_03555 [Thermosipho affectus]
MKKVIYSVFLALALYFLISFLLNISPPKERMDLNFDLSLPFYNATGKAKSVTLKSHFKNVGYDTLVINRISGNMLKVYLNGELVYKFGDLTANIWNKVFKIELKNLKEENELIIEIFGIYDVGLANIPFLTNYKIATRYVIYKEFFKEKFVYISIGISLISAIVSWIFGSSIKDRNLKISYLSFGIFLLFTALHLSHFSVRETMFNPNFYLMFLKIISLATYSSIVFYIYAVEVYKRNFFVSKWIVYVFVPILFLVSMSYDFVFYVKITQISNIIMIFFLIYAAIRVFYLKVEWLYFSSVFSAISVIHTIILLFYPSVRELLTGYAFSASAISVIIMISRDFKRVILEHSLLIEEVLTDPLTGAYNRKIIDKLRPGGYFILIDLNDFKELNDRYGHEYGDRVLKDFSKIVVENLPKKDYFIRLGGDEFAIITYFENPKGLVEKIRLQMKRKINLDFSYGISRYSQFERAYKKADEKLYKMKRQKSLKYKNKM